MFQAWLLVSPSSFWNVVVSAGSFLPACLLPKARVLLFLSRYSK